MLTSSRLTWLQVSPSLEIGYFNRYKEATCLSFQVVEIATSLVFSTPPILARDLYLLSPFIRNDSILVIQIDEDVSERVKLKGPYFRIYSHQKGDREHVKAQLDEWYRAHAEDKFAERLEEASKVMRKYGVEKPPMRVRRMKKRWGSCTSRGHILLNLDLIRAPRLCIDYVIAHELCHLKYPNHGTEFYNLLSRVMPDWKEIKARLREVQF